LLLDAERSKSNTSLSHTGAVSPPG
jgi:hypothetical protein